MAVRLQPSSSSRSTPSTSKTPAGAGSPDIAAGGATANGYGTYEMTAAGAWTYTLDDTDSAVQALNGAATLTDTFDAVTGDGTVQTVTITINAQDDFGVAQDDAVTTDEATAIVGGDVFADNGSGADGDVDTVPPVVTEVNGNAGDVGNYCEHGGKT